MPDFIYDIPQVELAIWFAAIAVGSTFLGILFVKPVLRLLIGREPGVNQNISYATSSISLFSGLLLSLLTVSAYQNKEAVEQSILDEAGAISALYSDMNSYPEPVRSDVKEMLRDYVQYTIYKDWPAHRQGEVMAGGVLRTDAMRQTLAAFEPQSEAQAIVHRETIAAFHDFTDFRRARVAGVVTRIPDVLWYAVLVGAVINILLLLMLKMRVLPHFILGAISSFFLGVVLFVIVALDDPLRGEAGLGPEPFELLWETRMIWDESQA